MPFAAPSFVQPSGAAASQTGAGSPVKPSVEPADAGAERFSKVYARASENQTAHPARAPKPEPTAAYTISNAPAVHAHAVADSGKALPDGKTKDTEDDSTAHASDEAGVTEPTTPSPAPVAPTLADAVPLPPEVQAPQWAAAATQPLIDEAFDPHADPLDDMPAVRLAMEQGGHVSAGSQPATKQASLTDTPDPVQGATSGMALLIDADAEASTSGEGGEKTFKGLVDEGLKDLTSASSDTRVDNFANRLAALTQAVEPKTTNALPVNQPLAMHQSGWSEEIVNRVMYLSSANLKSADIQLQPAELGRLDIRVNLNADQSAQVNFVSGHAGVREALDSQLHRLREMFAQQGLGQVDVNVSDQSRNWQGQGQEQQAQSRSSGHRLEGRGEEEVPVAAAAIAAPAVVLGSSAVDYYA